MSKFTLQHYKTKLDQQVLHMDQGLNYCPEFRATKMMHDYPSRKMQLARAVFKNELAANSYVSKILFKSILSRQGERWQNFGESAEDYTDVMILSRKMLIDKGCNKDLVDELLQLIKDNNGHVFNQGQELSDTWKKHMPVSTQSKTYLMIDDATYRIASKSARSVGDFFSKKEIALYPEIEPTFIGWEYFVYGLIDLGINHLEKLINNLKEKDIDTIITLSGQAHYVLDVFVRKLGLNHDFKIINILDMIDSLDVKEKAYLYAGSFYTRYLRKEMSINNLVVNETEELIKNCAEFIPLLNADKRVNRVTIWQKPISAEYSIFGIEDSIIDKIRVDAINDIKKGTQEQVIVFEPYAYRIMKEQKDLGLISYYLDLIVNW